jgi:hypothetical protein
MLQALILSEGIYQHGRRYINNRIKNTICSTAHTMQKMKFGPIMTNTTPRTAYLIFDIAYIAYFWLDDWEIVVQLLAGQKIFSFLTFQTLKPAPESTQPTTLGVKWLGSDAEHSIHLVAKLKISGAIPACHHTSSQYTQWQHNPSPWWRHVSNHTASEHAIEYGCQAISCQATDKPGQTSGKNRLWLL